MTAPMRRTWQRDAVRGELAAAKSFVSAQQLHAALLSGGRAIGLATVYRNLAQLATAGEADTLQSPEGETLYRSCEMKHHHHHLICRECGSTRELSANVVEKWAREVAAEHDFDQIDHVIDLFGVCADCRK